MLMQKSSQLKQTFDILSYTVQHLFILYMSSMFKLTTIVNITDLFISAYSKTRSLCSMCLFLLQQPHHILQKRLLEAKLSRGQMNMCTNNGGVLLNSNHLNLHEDEDEEDEGFIYVPCRVSSWDVYGDWSCLFPTLRLRAGSDNYSWMMY